MFLFRSSILILLLFLTFCRSISASQSELVLAIVADDVGRVESLIESEVDVNVIENDGSFPLLWAVYQRNQKLIEKLIDAGANLNTANRQGISALIMAAMLGNYEGVKSLIAAGADVNKTMPNGETALMMSARNGNLETLQVLLNAKAEVDAQESLRGTTALMWAAANRNSEAAKLLIENGADIEKLSSATKPGRGPYLAPSARSRINEFYFGVGAGGNTLSAEERDSVEAKFTVTREDLLQRFPKDLAQDLEADKARQEALPKKEAKQWGGLSALHLAVRENDLESIKILLRAGADINVKSEFGWTPLLVATQNRFYQVGAFLLENSADPNIANEGGWNPLYLAVDNRNIEGGDYPTRKPDMDHLQYVRLLLGADANPNLRMKSSTETRTIFTHQWLNESGATPFLRAAQSSDLELMRLLLDHGADPNLNTDIGVTPLMVAAGIGWVEGVTYEWSEQANVDVVKLLLELGNDPNAQESEDYRTALMGAAHKGRNAVVEILVSAGAKLDARDIGSRDSLHKLSGVRWQAVDYANGLVRVGVQSPTPHPLTEELLWNLMQQQNMEVPPLGRRLESISLIDD